MSTRVDNLEVNPQLCADVRPKITHQVGITSTFIIIGNAAIITRAAL